MASFSNTPLNSGRQHIITRPNKIFSFFCIKMLIFFSSIYKYTGMTMLPYTRRRLLIHMGWLPPRRILSQYGYMHFLILFYPRQADNEACPLASFGVPAPFETQGGTSSL